MTLASMNENNKFIFIFYLFIHTQIFVYFFYFFYFYFLFLFLGWTRPANPTRSLAQASDLARQKLDAHVKQFHACMNSAEIIKLPSHSVQMLLNAENEREMVQLLLEMVKMVATLVGTFIQLLSFISLLCPLSSLLLFSQFLR